MPKLAFPGGALIGCAAGFVNLPRIKGSHNAMKTGMLGGGSRVRRACARAPARRARRTIRRAFRASWVYDDLYKVRNVKPGLKWGMWLGTLHGGMHMWLNDLHLGGAGGWTLHHGKPDHESLSPPQTMPKIDYPKYDGMLTFDKLSSVFISNTNHEENQPSHLQLRDPAIPIAVNLAVYDGPEQRYCPAGVYEFVATDDMACSTAGTSTRSQATGDDIVHNVQRGAGDASDKAIARPAKRLQINAQNCVHCKTCDIKDPRQNIHWVTPEGGGGPNYSNM